MTLQIPPASDVVLRYLLERNANERPGELFLTYEDGTTWTRAQGLSEAYRAANRLADSGVCQGDRVAVFLPNGLDFLRAWWGTAVLGAVLVPVNPAFKGAMLAHAIGLSQPAAVVTDPSFATQLNNAAVSCPIVYSATLAQGKDFAPALERPLGPWDVQAHIFTSGTTGLSKASMTSYHQLYKTGSVFTVEAGLDGRDTFLIDLPLNHQAASSMVLTCLNTRTKLAIRTRPTMTSYWETAKQAKATIGFLLSSMVEFLSSQPQGPADTDHSMRLMVTSPLPADPEAFIDRFGLEGLMTSYGSTEQSGCTVFWPGDRLVPKSCGRRRPGYELRIVDEHDVEVPAEEQGELIVRTELPWMASMGYVKDPGATMAAWRNGWFHTGDLFRVDAAGNYFFEDRVRDALRRRGENISSFEVERDVIAHPAVAEVACVGAPSDVGVDDEVKVWIVPHPATELDLRELVEFLTSRMPHYMVPRYYEVVDELPKSTTMRVQKFVLRERGNGPETWDLESHGLRVTRQGLVNQ